MYKFDIRWKKIQQATEAHVKGKLSHVVACRVAEATMKPHRCRIVHPCPDVLIHSHRPSTSMPAAPDRKSTSFKISKLARTGFRIRVRVLRAPSSFGVNVEESTHSKRRKLWSSAKMSLVASRSILLKVCKAFSSWTGHNHVRFPKIPSNIVANVVEHQGWYLAWLLRQSYFFMSIHLIARSALKQIWWASFV